MLKKQIISSSALLVAVTFGLVTGNLSTRFPPVHTDEVVFSVHGYNLITGQGHRYSLYDDIFDRSVYVIRDALPDITRTFYNTWVGLWLTVTSRTYRHARWSSVVAGLLCLWVMYHIGRRLKGPSLGLILVLLAALNPIILYASCFVRPEIVLMLGTACAIWMVLAIPSRWPWKPYLTGLWCGLLTGVHWNAFAVMAGLAAFYASMPETGFQMRRLGLLVAGFLSGALLAFFTVDPGKFLLSLQTVNYLISTPPPILSGPVALIRGTLTTIKTFISGQTSYSHSELIGGWGACLASTWLSFGFGILGEGYRVLRKGGASPERQQVKAFVLGFGVTLFAMFLIVKRQELNYVLILLPYLFPIVGFCLDSPSKLLAPIGQALRLLSVASLLCGTLLYFSFALRYSEWTKPFDRIVEEIHLLAPNPSWKVAGPNVLWFGWPTEKFRDLGAVITSAWYVNGQKDVRGCLVGWRPDILVLDHPFALAIWGQDHPLAGMKKTLGVPVQLLGTVHTGEGAYQDWEIYQIDWPNAFSSS